MAVIWLIINLIRNAKGEKGSELLMEELGIKLSEAGSDKKKIYVTTVIRVVVLAAFLFAVSGGGKNFVNMGMLIVSVLIVLGIGLYPLSHLPEKIEFYDNGITYCGKAYLWSDLRSVEWRDHTAGGIFCHTVMATESKVFDVTYLEQVKKQYNKAYLKD